MCGLFVFVFAALGVSRHSGGRRHRSKKIFDRRSCVHVSASPITIISHLPTYLPTSIMIRALYVPLALGALLAFAAPARTSELQFKGDSRIFYQPNPPVSAAPTPSLPQNGPLYEFTRIGGTEAASTNERTNERTRSSDSTHSHTVSRSRSRSAQTIESRSCEGSSTRVHGLVGPLRQGSHASAVVPRYI